MGDVPGLDYQPPVPVDRLKLAGHDAVPEVMSYESEGGPRESALWRSEPAGVMSESPAHSFAFAPTAREQPLGELLRRLWECLELPGVPSDYHYALQEVSSELWSRRTAEPEAVRWLESVCWLNLRLIQAWPDAVRDEYAEPGGKEFFTVNAFVDLVNVYLREGLLSEAAKIADLAMRFGQGEGLRFEIDERLQVLRGEDGG